MRQALGVIGVSFRDWYYSMLGLVMINALWVVLSLTIILLPPATAGLYAATNSVARGTGQRLGDFWEGARRWAGLSFRWALLNLLVAAILWSNTLFYSTLSESLIPFVRLLVGSLALLWLMTQFYVWPFALEQEDKRLRIALKNALFLTLASPGYTLTLLITVALLTFASAAAILPLVIFLTSFTALLGNHAVLERLAAYGKLPQPVPSGGNQYD